MGRHFTGGRPVRLAPRSIRPPAPPAAPMLRMRRQTALLAHLVTQTAPVLQRQVAPAGGRLLAAKLVAPHFLAPDIVFLAPVLAHLLAHLAPLLGGQIAPRSLRRRTAHRAEQAQEQQRTGSKAFHGRGAIGLTDSIIVHPAGRGKRPKM